MNLQSVIKTKKFHLNEFEIDLYHIIGYVMHIIGY